MLRKGERKLSLGLVTGTPLFALTLLTLALEIGPLGAEVESRGPGRSVVLVGLTVLLYPACPPPPTPVRKEVGLRPTAFPG